MTAKASFRGVTKRFRSGFGREVTAVADLTLECRKGDFLCILGPTGCGKTSLLRLLAGLDAPDEGEVLVEGRPLVGVNREAGYAFQQGALFPWLRTLDNIAFPLRMRGAPRRLRQSKAEEWLRRVGLQGFAQAYPYELSGGMAQRAALARALISEPSLLLLDEPFGALDERTRYGLQDRVLTLWKETGATVVFVTHNIEEAVYLGRSIVVMGFPPESIVERMELTSPHPRDRLSEGFVKDLLRVRRVFEKVVGVEV